MTNLLTAAKSGNLKVMRKCISAGANVNVKDKTGSTPLHYASMSCPLDMINDLIAAGADLNAKDQDGWTTLHHMARGGHMDVMNILITAGADVNAKDEDDRTILHCSTFHNVEVMKILISAGAEVNCKDSRGQTPLHYVTRGSPLDFFMDHAEKTGCKDLLKVLIAAGADVNVKEKRGWTPLHFSAGGARLSFVKALVVAGANVNAKNSSQQTPLHFAAVTGNVEILKVLIAAGAVINSKDTDGVMPIEYAGLDYSEEACKLLIKYTMLHIHRPLNPQFSPGKITMRDVDNLIVFWNKCKRQVRKLKETFLGNTCVSFYKFLRETDENKIAFYCTEKNYAINNELRKALCNIKEFPLYAKDVEAQFNKGSKRARLLFRSQELMKSHFCKVLPAEIIRKISEYLKNKDLKTFLYSCKFSKDSSL